MAPVSATMNDTSILLNSRGAAAACVAMYHRTCGRKSARDRDVERSERTTCAARGARMPGRLNRSILSLVNRAVKSNIFMRE
jgi:hypothetical protein